MKYASLVFGIAAVALVLTACGGAPAPKKGDVLAAFPLNSIDGIISADHVFYDDLVSSDGHGSVRIETDEPIVVNLFQIDSIDIENARIVYQAQVKTEDLAGQAYLEMYCGFKDKGEYFSRDLQTPRRATSDWLLEETPFYLQPGQNPDYIKLNLVVNGSGTVWIDDIKLVKLPL